MPYELYTMGTLEDLVASAVDNRISVVLEFPLSEVFTDIEGFNELVDDKLPTGAYLCDISYRAVGVRQDGDSSFVHIQAEGELEAISY